MLNFLLSILSSFIASSIVAIIAGSIVIQKIEHRCGEAKTTFKIKGKASGSKKKE